LFYFGSGDPRVEGDVSISVIDNIDQLLEEHEKIHRGFKWLEQQANDLESALQLKDIRKRIDSERLTQTSWPQELENELSRIENQLGDHFSREESMLSDCCDKLEDAGFSSTLSRLRDDHNEILGRIEDLRAEARGIDSDSTSREDWIDKSFVIRVHITNARVFLEKHADQESLLFKMLRDRLSSL